jgi:actin-related protein 9
MESPVQLSIFPGLPRPSCELICQMFFERFNVAGFSILERPMAQIYSSNALSGLIIDLGYHWTDISAVYDGFLLHQARASTPVGIKACLAFLAQVLKTNTSIAATLSPSDNPLSPEALHQAFQDLASTLYHNGYVKPPVLGQSQLASGEAEEGVTDIASIIVAGKERAVIEANIKKRANQKASAAEQAKLKEIEALDLLTIEFNGKEVTVGKERHRFCDPLFDPRVLKHVPGLEATLFGHSEKEKEQNPVMSVSEAAWHVLSRTEIDQRQYILGSPSVAGGLLATGDMTSYIKGLLIYRLGIAALF